MKQFLWLLCFATALISCNQDKPKTNVWTEEYEKYQFRQIDESLKLRLTDSDRRHQIVYYIVTKLKTALPNGVESVPPDSLQRLSRAIGRDYAVTQIGQKEKTLVPHKVPWIPEIEKD